MSSSTGGGSSLRPTNPQAPQPIEPGRVIDGFMEALLEVAKTNGRKIPNPQKSVNVRRLFPAVVKNHITKLLDINSLVGNSTQWDAPIDNFKRPRVNRVLDAIRDFATSIQQFIDKKDGPDNTNTRDFINNSETKHKADFTAFVAWVDTFMKPQGNAPKSQLETKIEAIEQAGDLKTQWQLLGALISTITGDALINALNEDAKHSGQPKPQNPPKPVTYVQYSLLIPEKWVSDTAPIYRTRRQKVGAKEGDLSSPVADVPTNTTAMRSAIEQHFQNLRGKAAGTLDMKPGRQDPLQLPQAGDSDYTGPEQERHKDDLQFAVVDTNFTCEAVDNSPEGIIQKFSVANSANDTANIPFGELYDAEHGLALIVDSAAIRILEPDVLDDSTNPVVNAGSAVPEILRVVKRNLGNEFVHSFTVIHLLDANKKLRAPSNLEDAVDLTDAAINAFGMGANGFMPMLEPRELRSVIGLATKTVGQKYLQAQAKALVLLDIYKDVYGDLNNPLLPREVNTADIDAAFERRHELMSSHPSVEAEKNKAAGNPAITTPRQLAPRGTMVRGPGGVPAYGRWVPQGYTNISESYQQNDDGTRTLINKTTTTSNAPQFAGSGADDSGGPSNVTEGNGASKSDQVAPDLTKFADMIKEGISDIDVARAMMTDNVAGNMIAAVKLVNSLRAAPPAHNRPGLGGGSNNTNAGV